MKKPLPFLLVFVLALTLSGCFGGRNDSRSTGEDHGSNGSWDHSASCSLKEEAEWSEQDVAAMFTAVKEADWTYIDCVLMPDKAYNRVGAVLYWDEVRGTSMVAFFDGEGNYVQAGPQSKAPDGAELTYLGNGAVTFPQAKEDGTVYNFTLTLSIDGDHVHFEAEDDLPKKK